MSVSADLLFLLLNHLLLFLQPLPDRLVLVPDLQPLLLLLLRFCFLLCIVLTELVHLSLEVLSFLLFVFRLLLSVLDELSHLNDIVCLLLQIIVALGSRVLEVHLPLPDSIEPLVLLLLRLRQVVILAHQFPQFLILLQVT